MLGILGAQENDQPRSQGNGNKELREMDIVIQGVEIGSNSDIRRKRKSQGVLGSLPGIQGMILAFQAQNRHQIFKKIQTPQNQLDKKRDGAIVAYLIAGGCRSPLLKIEGNGMFLELSKRFRARTQCTIQGCNAKHRGATHNTRAQRTTQGCSAASVLKILPSFLDFHAFAEVF